MHSSGRWWYVDLVVTAVATAVCAAGVAAGLGGVPRFLVAAPLVLFLPGYALVSAFFPRGEDSAHDLGLFDERTFGLGNELPVTAVPSGIGRIGLSVLASIGVVSVVTLAANFTPAGVRFFPVFVGVTGATGLFLVAAVLQRLRLSPRDRFSPSFRPSQVWFTPSSSGIDADRRWEAGVPNVLLVVGVVLLCASVGYAALSPPETQEFTEFYVETDNMTIDTTTLYHENYARGQQQTLSVHVGNREGESTDYAVVAQLHRVDEANRTVTRQHLATAQATVAADATKQVDLSVRPTVTGDDLRIVLLLYRGDVPSNPSAASAYRTLRIDVTVSESSDAVARPRGV